MSSSLVECTNVQHNNVCYVLDLEAHSGKDEDDMQT